MANEGRNRQTLFNVGNERRLVAARSDLRSGIRQRQFFP